MGPRLLRRVSRPDLTVTLTRSETTLVQSRVTFNISGGTVS